MSRLKAARPSKDYSFGPNPVRSIGGDWLMSIVRGSIFTGYRRAHSTHVSTPGTAARRAGGIGRPQSRQGFVGSSGFWRFLLMANLR